jgi:hypothetical protein
MRKMRRAGCVTAAAITLGCVGAIFAQSARRNLRLEQGFQAPPDSAKPRTWWHWTNGNVTEEGITKDLEWMKRVGIGGIPDCGCGAGSGQVVEPKINFGTPEWYHAVRHRPRGEAAELEMSIFSCAGLERGRRAVGEARDGDEAAGVERDARGGPQDVQREAAGAAFE